MILSREILEIRSYFKSTHLIDHFDLTIVEPLPTIHVAHAV